MTRQPEDTSQSQPPNASTAGAPSPKLARSLGLFDATMIVMGGIIGSGIFMNPSVVARQVHTPFLILGAWVFGGLIALGGAFIYAELAARRPEVGGQYAYIREAYHPAVAFIYGWALLLVIQTGGMAAVAVTFGRYFIDLTHIPMSDWMVAALALALRRGGSGQASGAVDSRIRIRVVADPTIRSNVHELDVEGDCGRVHCRIQSRPSANPKTSEIAVRSAIATLQRIFNPVSIGT